MDSSQTAGALSGAATGAKVGSAFGPWGTVIGGVIGGVAGYFGSSSGKKINIADVIAQAQQQARNNLQNSINLENEFLPGTAKLRQTSNQLNADLSQGLTPAQQTQLGLLDQAQNPITNPWGAVNNPLTVGSLESILSSLNKGGNLDPDVQAMAVQAALQKGGQAGIAGSGTGRGLVARDLGLTSLQLLQSRQNQAIQAGTAYGAQGLAAGQLQLQDYMDRLTGANNAVGLQQQYGINLGQLMAATPYPNSGLGPGQVTDLSTGAIKFNNGFTQQQNANYMSMFNTAAGYVGGGGLSGLAGLFKTSNTGGDAGGITAGAGNGGAGLMTAPGE